MLLFCIGWVSFFSFNSAVFCIRANSHIALDKFRKLYVFATLIRLFMNFQLAQTSIAIISLTYNMDDGTNWNGTYTRPGVAKAANLTGYFKNNGKSLRFSPKNYQAAAHTYGELSQSMPCGPYNEISDIEKSRKDHGYFCRRAPGQRQFAHRFSEYNPDDLQKNYPLFTNRVITASAGQCYEYTEASVKDSRDKGGNKAWDYEYTNGSVTGHIVIPKNNQNADGTTYIHRGINVPENATAQFCGPRCMYVWAHKVAESKSSSLFYQCPITISTVSNVVNNTQSISDEVARVAASSIALSGLPIWDGERQIWTQYQFYPFGYLLFPAFGSFKLTYRLGANGKSTTTPPMTSAQIWPNLQ